MLADESFGKATPKEIETQDVVRFEVSLYL
jgi:hypothetical protein